MRTRTQANQYRRYRFFTRLAVVLAGLLSPLFTLHTRAFQTSQPPGGILLGVVTLSQVPAGQETSASVVTDPQTYAEVPGLRVMTVQAPQIQGQVVESAASSSNGMLEGVVVDMGDGRKQPGDKPLTWIPQLGNTVNTITMLLRDVPDHPIATGTVPIDRTGTPTAPGSFTPAAPTHDVSSVTPTPSTTAAPTAANPVTTAGDQPAAVRQPQPPVTSTPTASATETSKHVASTSSTMPPVAAQGGVQVIHGDTSGNSNAMKIKVDEATARIVAAKPGTVFWKVPDTLMPGPHEVTFTPGPGMAPVKFPLYILGLKMSADQTKLIKGQSTRMHVTVEGLDRLPASVWQSGLPPSDLVDLTRWGERAGGLHPPKPSDPGTVVLVLENQSPETIRMGKQGTRIVLQLHQQDFANGSYTYEDKVQSLRSGGFSIRGTVTVFLKPSAGVAL